MSQPIIPWQGGKRRLADRLLPLFPPHECYVEVPLPPTKPSSAKKRAMLCQISRALTGR